jgi:DNA topoisomerase 6 subunit A-like protein
VEHTAKRLDPEKGYDTFKGILDAYQRERGKIEGLYYDPRGRLREPHGGKTVDVGTREIESYTFPHLTFDKILYVEKEGIWPQLEASALAERYDMAILTGKGYATEAARTLFEKAEEDDYQLFVFHDADPDGYNIARTLREETSRMPGYSVQVEDIGLTIEDAEDRGLLPETFTRKKGLPKELELTEREQECFVGSYRGEDGNGKEVYTCTRYEINALKTAPEKIAYIEEKLKEKGIRGKVIPPEGEMDRLAEGKYRKKVRGWVNEVIAEVLASDELKNKMAHEFQDRFKLGSARTWIETEFKHRDDSKS